MKVFRSRFFTLGISYVFLVVGVAGAVLYCAQAD
jgi:hypothetical protein